jgi:hypothetical protein
MTLLCRYRFPTPRPMPSRQVVLLTPLESSRPQPSLSRHRINLMNIDFPVVDPLYFQTLTGVYFATHLFPTSYRNGGGCTPLSAAPSAELTLRRLDIWTLRRSTSSLSATFMDHHASVANKRLTVRLNPLDATFTKNRGGTTSCAVLGASGFRANGRRRRWLDRRGE